MQKQIKYESIWLLCSDNGGKVSATSVTRPMVWMNKSSTTHYKPCLRDEYLLNMNLYEIGYPFLGLRWVGLHEHLVLDV